MEPTVPYIRVVKSFRKCLVLKPPFHNFLLIPIEGHEDCKFLVAGCLDEEATRRKYGSVDVDLNH